MMWFGKYSYTLPGTLFTFLQNRYSVFVQVYPFSSSTLISPPPSPPQYTVPVICPAQFSSPLSFSMSFLVQPLVLCCFILLLPSAVYCHGRGLHFPLSYPSPLPGSISRWVRSIAGWCCRVALFACCSLFFLSSFRSPWLLSFTSTRRSFSCQVPTPSPPQHSFLLQVTQVFKDLRCFSNSPSTPRHSTTRAETLEYFYVYLTSNKTYF